MTRDLDFVGNKTSCASCCQLFQLKFSIQVDAKVFETAHKISTFSVLERVHKQSIITYH